MPESWAVGLSYRFSDKFGVSVDYARIEWDNFILRDEDGNETNVMGKPTDTNEIDATNIVRAGLEYLWFFERFIVPVRAGAFYDPHPASKGTRDFFGFSVGSGFIYRSLSIDCAYQLRMAFNDRENHLFDILGEGGLEAMKEDLYRHPFMFSAIVRF